MDDLIEKGNVVKNEDSFEHTPISEDYKKDDSNISHEDITNYIQEIIPKFPNSRHDVFNTAEKLIKPYQQAYFNITEPVLGKMEDKRYVLSSRDKTVYFVMLLLAYFEILAIVVPGTILTTTYKTEDGHTVRRKERCDINGHAYYCNYLLGTCLMISATVMTNIMFILFRYVHGYWAVNQTSPAPWVKFAMLSVIITIFTLFEVREFSISTIIGFSMLNFFIYLLPAINLSGIPTILCPLSIFVYSVLILIKFASTHSLQGNQDGLEDETEIDFTRPEAITRIILVLTLPLATMFLPFSLLVTETIGPFKKYHSTREYLYMLIEILFIICIEIRVLYVFIEDR